LPLSPPVPITNHNDYNNHPHVHNPMAKKKKFAPRQNKSNRTLLYAGLAVLAIAALAILFFSGSSTPADSIPVMQVNMSPSEPGKVRLVEFFKFDCPHCYNLHRDLPGLLASYGDRVEIVYVAIVFPGQSTKSIEAYMIARHMGNETEMRDALFSAEFEQKRDIMTSTSAIETVAASIGLGEDFNKKLEGKAGRKAARANLAEMQKYLVDTTPTVFVNGKKLVTPSVAELNATISAALVG